MMLWQWVALTFAVLCSVPFIVISIELFAALLPARRISDDGATRPRVAVLVPVHNEELHIRRTLEHIRTQLLPTDRAVVIADNCSDATAAIARECGAGVIERQSLTDRGKGFALDAGIQHLRGDPPAVVIVVDADTVVLPGAIDGLATAVERTGRPQQGEYLLEAAKTAGPPRRLAAFAFLVKNAIRPRGMDRLGLPCLLYGAGMAFPWEVLSRVDLAHGDITEDIRLGAELAQQGHPVAYCPAAQVRGKWPEQPAAARTQRQRWEHGHLRTIMREVPRLILAGLTKFRFDLLALALHLGVAPLSLLFLSGVAGLAVLAIAGQGTAAWIVLAALVIAVFALFLVWLRFARQQLRVSDIAAIPFYLVKKIPLYLRFFVRPQREWVRTGRDGQSQSAMVEQSNGK